MKKILAVIASLTLTSSGTLTVFSCQTLNAKKAPINEEAALNNNDSNNLTGAIASVAKSIILDNEFGISQKASMPVINNQLASKTINGFNPLDRGLNGNSRVSDVVNKYVIAHDDSYRSFNSSNVQLGNKKGEGSGLDELVPDAFKEIFGTIKNLVLPWINQRQDQLTGQRVVNFLNGAYSGKYDGEVNAILFFLKELGAKDLINGVKGLAPAMSVYFKSIFGEEKIFNQMRFLNDQLFDSNADTYLIKTLYEDTGNQNILPVNQIKLERVKAELMLSVIRLLKLIYVIPEETDPAFSNIEKGSDEEIALIFGNFLNQSFTNQKWQSQNIEDQLTPFFYEFFRIITILNAYFSFFDATKTFEAKDSQHLFSAEKNNYEYLSEVAGGKTLGDSTYVQDKAINLNYFLANLDYYFGSTSMENEQSAYRFQQGLFLLVNDPVANYRETNPNNYENKPSFIVEQLVQTFLIMGTKMTTGTTHDILVNLYQDNFTKHNISNMFVKPLFLGFLNGNDLYSSLSIIKGMIQGLDKLIPALGFFKNYFDDLVEILDRVQREYNKETIHHFLLDDLRPLFSGLSTINNDLLNRWFGWKQKINLQTMLTQPIAKIFQVFNLDFFNINRSPFGENFFNSSFPELLNLINLYFNKFNEEADVQTMAYQTTDPLTSFKSLNLDLSLIQKLIASTIGDLNGGGNILSTIIESLFTDGDNEAVKQIGLNFEEMVKRLGMKAENTFDQNSFLGVILKIFLPLSQSNGTDLVLNNESYQIDLFGLWMKNLLDIINKLDTIGNYQEIVNQFLEIEKTFTVKLKENELEYFGKNQQSIQRISVEVEFINPMNLKISTYLFRAARLEPEAKFDFVRITSNKI